MCVQNLNPTVWWDCVKKTGDGVPAELCDLASLLLKLPASSASIERIFSNFGNVQSKLRNRLGIDKAAKLVTYATEVYVVQMTLAGSGNWRVDTVC